MNGIGTQTVSERIEGWSTKTTKKHGRGQLLLTCTSVQPCVTNSNNSSGRGGLGTDSIVSLASNNSIEDSDMDSDDEIITLCTSSRKRNKPKWKLMKKSCNWKHLPSTILRLIMSCLVPDLLQINNNPCYWGVMDKYAADSTRRGKPEGTFLLEIQHQETIFSPWVLDGIVVLFTRSEQWNHNFSFDAHDPCVFHSPDITGLLEHYKDRVPVCSWTTFIHSFNWDFPPFPCSIYAEQLFVTVQHDGIDALPIPLLPWNYIWRNITINQKLEYSGLMHQNNNARKTVGTRVWLYMYFHLIFLFFLLNHFEFFYKGSWSPE